LIYVLDACALIAFLAEEIGEGYEAVDALPVSLPIETITTISDTVYHETARYKARYSISLADAFLCATAKSLSATIVTKDGEIKPVEQAENLSVLWIK